MAKFAGKDAVQFVKARSSRLVKAGENLDVYQHSFTDTVGEWATVTKDRREVRFFATLDEVKREIEIYG